MNEFIILTLRPCKGTVRRASLLAHIVNLSCVFTLLCLLPGCSTTKPPDVYYPAPPGQDLQREDAYYPASEEQVLQREFEDIIESEEQDLQREFEDIVESILSEAGIPLTADLGEFIAGGVERLQDKGDVELARSNIRKFAQELVRQSVAVDVNGAVGYRTANEEAFRLTLLSICPLYPFC